MPRRRAAGWSRRTDRREGFLRRLRLADLRRLQEGLACHKSALRSGRGCRLRRNRFRGGRIWNTGLWRRGRWPHAGRILRNDFADRGEDLFHTRLGVGFKSRHTLPSSQLSRLQSRRTRSAACRGYRPSIAESARPLHRPPSWQVAEKPQQSPRKLSPESGTLKAARRR